MKCPDCGRGTSRVLRTYRAKDGSKRRYHRCENCGFKFKSREVVLEQGTYREGENVISKQIQEENSE